MPEETGIPWLEKLTEAEVRAYTIGYGNTSPNADGTCTELVSASWESVGLFITQLFRAFIRYLAIIYLTLI